jgi:hypothetical protein
MPKLHLLALIGFISLSVCFLACGDDDDSGGGDDDLVNDDVDDDVNDDTADDDADDDVDDDDTVCNGCWIAGQCFDEGDANPNNPCEKCDATVAIDAWTALVDATPCDDGQWCNGDDACLAGACSDHDGNPCADDGLFCNGGEFCDETGEACGHIGNPCTDDTLYCNGAETCDEDVDQCVHSGDPCDDPLICDELEDDCDPPTTTSTTTSTTTTTQEPTTTTTFVGTTTTTQEPTTTTTTTTTWPTTTCASIVTTSTTTTVVTTTSTTTSTQGDCAGFELRGSSLFNDAIDLCINTQARADYFIEGDWDLFTGRENDSDWYDMFTINIAADVPMTLIQEYSTDEYEYYYFEQGAVYGQMISWLTSGAKSMIVIISGTIDGQDDVFDVIYLTNQPVECPDNHSPMLSYELVGEYTCETTPVFVDYYEFDDEGVWQVPMDDCFAIMFAFSNADCNWIGGNQYYLQSGVWEGLGDPFDEDSWITTGCSWYDSDGDAIGLFYNALEYEATYTYTNKIMDGCGVSSNIVETQINFFEEL